ncbi:MULTISPECIES: STAS domain-containing protein [Pseudanabaena]|uniref:Anti-sigma factor antagonist n=2 Tax=Pseudanabaena TaxID=1152 RepID=L8N257_9CYAN|nr:MULTISPECIES: STAS domain-containing protein [Pseudanabaena]ELS33174.1 anti-sigma-factor antagonist [Pseudanabaena biceps PCC 7429]MDG3494604.1 STAS domain-containing protein [Pseudanabaena catenata USMAC16]
MPFIFCIFWTSVEKANTIYPQIKVRSYPLEVIIPEPLTLTVSLRGSLEVKDNYQLIRLAGLLDAFSEPAFKKVIGKCVEDGPYNVILDLSTIDFIDSSGLGVLVQMAKKTQTLDGTLQIITNARVTQTVKLVRLDQFLTLQTSIDEALAKLAKTSKD